MNRRKANYAFIDASNLFYGGEKSLGWKIDYQKLIRYIKKRYLMKKVFYYGGVELDGFEYSILDKNPINLSSLILYLQRKLKEKNTSDIKKISVQKHIQRIKFYLKLSEFGYILKLKPVKIFKDNGRITKKANCDVDMTFDMMRHKENYQNILVLSGDGDFAVVLLYLKKIGRKVTILARGERTAREIRQIAGSDFRDFNYLKELLKFQDIKKRRLI